MGKQGMWSDIKFNSVNINSEIKIVRLGEGETIINEKYQSDLKTLVEMLDDNYPGIDIWYNNKVLPGLKEKERFAYVIYSNEIPVGLTIVKKDKNAKICSMRISPKFQRQGVGTLLFSLIARQLKNVSEKVHFTVPESIYNDKKSFFEKFGFIFLGEAGQQYRLFDREFLCEVETSVLWENVLKNIENTIQDFTLIGNPAHPDLVMSIKPEFADKIKRKEKKIEVRRKFNKKWQGAYALLYASEPMSEFFGEARISKIIEGEPKNIWNLFGSELGVDEKKYFEYCAGTDKVNALILSDINIFRNGITKTRVEYLLSEELKAPQSYSVIKEGTSWPTAVSLNYLLMA